MAKIPPVWALDIGQAALKALKLVPGPDPQHVVAEAFDFVEYPKILSQPDADPEALVREALQTFLERNDLKGCKVAIAVAGQAGLVKFIKLPPVEKKRIPDIVKFEARQQIPFALEEVIWDYQQIGGDDDDGSDDGFSMAEVGLFAMKRDQISRAVFPFQAANIEVDLVQMGPIALFNFATFDPIKPEDKDKGSIVLLDIGADNTDLIITDGNRIWQRNVPIGGNHFTRALTKELKLTFAKAEHLKRNATKAPDPRAVFTAMRGVFNDFASEVNRSIGFYSSVNRTAKIHKIIGLGNGFKLPGLQKFLQQNLTFEVEKLEGFEHLTGDDVKGSPQFQENLPSFAVAYGLGLQGLNLGKLHTNLLPPEIERVRMVRRKKPWAMAAACLLAVGAVGMGLADYAANAKVNSVGFSSAVAEAKNASTAGAGFKQKFDKSKADWTRTLDEGKSLLPEQTSAANMAEMLQQINLAMPDPTVHPVTGKKLNPEVLSDRSIMDRNRVHIDVIRPVWVADLSKWYTDLADPIKPPGLLFHPLDRKNPPAAGEGWMIQIVGHHYNPMPKTLEDRKAGIDLGPVKFLTARFLNRLNSARLREFGFHHATISWLLPDTKWIGEKADLASALPANVPLLARNVTPPVATTGGTGGMGNPGSMMPSSSSGPMVTPRMPMGGPSMIDPRALRGSMLNSENGMGGPNAATLKATKTRTRTEFKIEFIWKPDDKPKDLATITKELQDAEKAVKGATETPKEAAFADASIAASAKVLSDDAAKAPAHNAATPATTPAPAPAKPN